MMTRSLFLVLVIVARINIIFASMKEYDLENFSPVGIDISLSDPPKRVDIDYANDDNGLITISGSEDETSNQEIKGATVNEKKMESHENPIQPSVKSSVDEDEAAKKARIEKLRKWYKKADPHCYYNTPFIAGEYLPAYKAALHSDIEKLKIMAGYNIDFGNYDAKTGETPLHAACRTGNDEVFDFITDQLKNVSGIFTTPSRTGSTPVSVAAASGNVELVLKMLRLGLSNAFNLPDNYGRTPIMYAALNNHVKVFNILRGIGKNYLKQDNSGRTLLSMISPANPIYELLIQKIATLMNEDRKNAMRLIAKDISVIIENDKFEGLKTASGLLSKFGTNLKEMINTPMMHQSNPLMAILKHKNYVYFEKFLDSNKNSFDINSSNAYDKYSFFERCLQYGTLEMIDYLLFSGKCQFYDSSLEAIFKVDREEVLQFLFEKYPHLLKTYDHFKIVVYAGNLEANKCFKFLLKKFWNSNDLEHEGMDLFCQAAVQICRDSGAGPINNLFNNFGKGIAECPTEYLLAIDDSLDDYDYYDGEVKEVRSYLRLLLQGF